jgi:2-hydroxy-4-(methylsulfanyl)butanoate S-methyltransferase
MMNVDVSEMLRGYVPAAALGTALERGLFWMLAEGPQSAQHVATELDIPLRRCRIWLEFLVGLQLLDRVGQGYVASARAKSEILDVYSRETWQFLAMEARERDLAGHDLAVHMGYRGSVWEAQGTPTPDYVARMANDPERARRFTRMSYELNSALADELAQVLNLDDARRLLDLGGGSGVVSLALLRRHPELAATVIDLETVCAAGREIAAGMPEGSRLSFHATDFLRDDLPLGYDVILACKVGEYGGHLYEKAARALAPGGRLIVVDKLVAEGVGTPFSGLVYAFLSSLQDPAFYLISVSEVLNRLVAVGLHVLAIRSLTTGETVIETYLEK